MLKGTCTLCGKENCNLTILDDIDRVCDQCLDYGYIQCDVCGEYWADWAVEFTYTDDGRTICQNCIDDQDDE